MIQTSLEFGSLYFVICLEFEFCYLGFNRLHFGIGITLKQFTHCIFGIKGQPIDCLVQP
jgi:hypothetical protein